MSCLANCVEGIEADRQSSEDWKLAVADADQVVDDQAPRKPLVEDTDSIAARLKQIKIEEGRAEPEGLKPSWANLAHYDGGKK